jgi:hypothetical protein
MAESLSQDGMDDMELLLYDSCKWQNKQQSSSVFVNLAAME